MVFIIGGSYQGKLDYARERFGLSDAEIQVCGDDTSAIDFGRRCIAYVDRYALNRLRAGESPVEAFWANLGRLSGAVVIANDISAGVVPVDPLLRAWREECGRINALLAGRADEVWRLFCGLPQRLK